MSMTHLHPALEAYAHAISMIDAVTGHQPSPLDGEHLVPNTSNTETKTWREKRQNTPDRERVVIR